MKRKDKNMEYSFTEILWMFAMTAVVAWAIGKYGKRGMYDA